MAGIDGRAGVKNTATPGNVMVMELKPLPKAAPFRAAYPNVNSSLHMDIGHQESNSHLHKVPMVLLLLLYPLLHRFLGLLHVPLHFHDFFQARTNRLARAVVQDIDVQVERYAGVEPGYTVLVEEEEAAMQVEPLPQLEACHAGGEVGLALEAGEIGGADRRQLCLWCMLEGNMGFGMGSLVEEKCKRS
jgi:hypothetical protein